MDTLLYIMWFDIRVYSTTSKRGADLYWRDVTGVISCMCDVSERARALICKVQRQRVEPQHFGAGRFFFAYASVIEKGIKIYVG